MKINALLLMAAAIDDNCLVNEYRDAAARVARISVLASQRDEVLKWAFPVGNPLSGIVTRGDPYWHAALGRTGPNPSGSTRESGQSADSAELLGIRPR